MAFGETGYEILIAIEKCEFLLFCAAGSFQCFFIGGDSPKISHRFFFFFSHARQPRQSAPMKPAG